ncbi:MAG: hypothetical protein IT574_08165 [Candidatus Aureabacteria bacterium]|jgi:radical SAM superfamily enzyme YgiQ (UPF0313 family)|nr:hypothetical protein [Candidatus Auribacterota bacterium]
MRGAFFIIGRHPRETAEEIEMMPRLTRWIDADFTAFSVFTPCPGTPLYEMMRAGGVIGEEKWEHLVHHHPIPAWRMHQFIGEELMCIKKKLIRRGYCTPYFMFRTLRRCVSVPTCGTTHRRTALSFATRRGA